MSQTYELKQGEYESKEKALVEIVMPVEPARITVTEENILKTIETLEEKKIQTIASIDAEIQINQTMLEGVREANKNATINTELRTKPVGPVETVETEK